MSGDYRHEDLGYRHEHEKGARYYQHEPGDALGADLEHLFGWDGFPGPGGQLLELGCGDGFTTKFLARRGLDVTGIDSSPAAIRQAERNLQADGLTARFRVGDVCDLEGLDDGSADAMLDSHCLHCIVESVDRARFLGACHRVLSDSGRLFIATMAEQSMHWTASDTSNQKRYELDDRGCYYQTLVYDGSTERVKARLFIKEELLRAEVRAAGFTIERFETFADPNDPEDLTFLAALTKA